MNRRGFFGYIGSLIAAATAGLFCRRSTLPGRREHEIEAYSFDWSTIPPYTDDPKHQKTLGHGDGGPRGDYNLCLVNGRRVRHVERMITGERGFIVAFRQNAQGRFYYDPATDSAARQVFLGRVEYHDLRYSKQINAKAYREVI